MICATASCCFRPWWPHRGSGRVPAQEPQPQPSRHELLLYPAAISPVRVTKCILQTIIPTWSSEGAVWRCCWLSSGSKTQKEQKGVFSVETSSTAPVPKDALLAASLQLLQRRAEVGWWLYSILKVFSNQNNSVIPRACRHDAGWIGHLWPPALLGHQGLLLQA